MFNRLKKRFSGLVGKPENAVKKVGVAELLQSGYQCFSRGEDDKAENLYQEILSTDQNNVDAHYLLGKLYAKKGAHQLSEQHLICSVNAKPDFIDARLDLGALYQFLGNGEGAIVQYESILALHADNAQALAGIGRTLQAGGRWRDSLDYFERCLREVPDDASFSYSLGVSLHSLGRSEEALACFDRSLDLQPENAAAHNARGVSLKELGRADAALTAFRQAAELDAGLADAQFNIAIIFKEKGDYRNALDGFNRCLELQPTNKDAATVRGVLLRDEGLLEEAKESFELAASIAPDFAEAHCGLGLVYLDLDDLDEAVYSFEMALHFKDDYIEALFGLGRVSEKRGDYAEAANYYRRVVELQPDYAPGHCNLGVVLQKEVELGKAISCYERALEIEPNFVEAHNNMGLALRELGDFSESLECYERALELQPDYLDALSNKGMVLTDLGRLEEANACLDQVLEEDKQHLSARWQRAITKLLMGRFEEAWDEYRVRWESEDAPPRPFHYLEWDGQELAGRRLLIFGEQGLGDEIMFSSCIPDLLAEEKDVVLECDARLADIFRRSFPEILVHGAKRSDDGSWVARVPELDVQLPIGDLPRLYRRHLSDFPARKGYLVADQVKVSAWTERLSRLGDRPKVGISWKGGTKKTRKWLRSVDIKSLAPIFQVQGVDFISLQYGDVSDELAWLEREGGVQLHHYPEAISDYDETAALISSLDLVISVQTAVIHLGGALGVNVWGMLPFSPEWRYMRDTKSMPWYPSVHLCRQGRPGEWVEVIQEIAGKLDRWIRSEKERVRAI